MRTTYLIVGLLLMSFGTLSTPAHCAPGQPSENTQVTSIMDQRKLELLFPTPYQVGQQDSELAVWPLYKQEVTGLNLVGYIYESIDYSSIPGFMGIPYNLLVVIDTQGQFVDVKVLFHREPMFIAGLGEEPMNAFVEQYRGVSLMQNIKFNNKHGQGKASDGNNVYLDGVSGATASIRILNQTLLSSALKVARARLGFGTAKDPDLIAKIDYDVFQEMSWSELLQQGLIKRVTVNYKEATGLFTHAEGWFNKDPNLTAGDTFISLYVTDLAIPSVGRNLLSEPAWQMLNADLKPGDHAILAISTGLYSFKHEDTLRGGISDRLLLRQEGLPIEIRDTDFSERFISPENTRSIHLPPALQHADWMIYRAISTSGIDISLPLDFELTISQPESLQLFRANNDYFNFSFKIPEPYYFEPSSNDKTWIAIWQKRWLDITILILALALLTCMLVYSRTTANTLKRLNTVRSLYLVFTLFFIGWHAQGQLSIVNITGIIQALQVGRSLDFFLYDPMTLLLWLYVLVTLVFWGRATFCGWLCPFGALQELVTKLKAHVKLPTFKPSDRLDRRLKMSKYGILLVLIVAAVFWPQWADRLVEIEPFKTSITFYFIRYWPYTVWAVLAVLASVFVYRGFCRYLCPLGAALALLGNIRRLDWLKRRAQCGTPCQLCKHSCQYNAITSNGAIEYSECFQCLDCVAIYHNDTLCAPLIIEKRKQQKNNLNQVIASDVG